MLVRYLTQDDPAQARRANAFIAGEVASGARCFVGAVVLCELVWVLRGAYGLRKTELVRTLERILSTAQFEIGERDVALRALEDFRAGRGDFADYMIGRQAREAGCSETATFDARLEDSPLFRFLGA
ncbi:MAG TPA: type II toxin-antitoxin system VapC family toxin [Vicinamibacteria bacterium]|nr:type II toxin-antitoxin system VapC family toxin [Vicinamibacteria bacterium]